jgi:hypothetical protein
MVVFKRHEIKMHRPTSKMQLNTLNPSYCKTQFMSYASNCTDSGLPGGGGVKLHGLVCQISSVLSHLSLSSTCARRCRPSKALQARQSTLHLFLVCRSRMCRFLSFVSIHIRLCCHLDHTHTHTHHTHTHGEVDAVRAEARTNTREHELSQV